jgi:LytS/YehU family sensor histidine kinase
MAMLRSYLEIELSRLGELLTVEIGVDPAVEREKLPRLLLLPLVENALKYGAATSPDRVQLRLKARRGSDELVIEIANSGTWVEQPQESAVPSLGIGHDNIRERLARYYPGRHSFEHSAADGWVTVRLVLPLASAA